MPDLLELWTVERVAEWLDVHPETVRQAIRAGRMGYYRLHRSLYVSPEQLAAYVDAAKCPPRDAVPAASAAATSQPSVVDEFRREVRIYRSTDRQMIHRPTRGVNPAYNN